ncbi:hypothetical protein KJ359_011432 [Pestalotiopsis sp. 9143b]|nr:hypothetical protein KJ359_011432 [Pestalotiopsis sp. 9143b]
MDPSGFIPRQAMPFDSELFKIIGADETLTNAKLEMELLPPFPPDSIIHDAACGLGPVTQSILATSPPDSIQIQASDSAPPMAGIYNQIAAAKGWPSRAVVMDAQNLSAVPDGAFSHVFLSFGQPIIDDPAAAAWEMHRTLRPGGTADVELHEKSAFLPVDDMDRFAAAIWTAIGRPAGGWTPEDEDRWDEAVAKYKELLPGKSGFHVDGDGRITLEAIAQIAIVRKTA